MSDVWGSSGTVQFVNRLHFAFFSCFLMRSKLVFVAIRQLSTMSFLMLNISTIKLTISCVSLVFFTCCKLAKSKVSHKTTQDIFGLNLGTKASNISRKAGPGSTEC